MEKSLFFGGVPTAPDVRRIREAYPERKLSVGQLIPYSEIAKLINSEHGTSRFRSVTNSWRKIVENETGIIIGSQPTEGFYVLSESEKVLLAGSQLRASKRRARRSYMVGLVVNISQITEEEKVALEHQQNVAGKIMASAQIKRKKQLPQMTNGGEKLKCISIKSH